MMVCWLRGSDQGDAERGSLLTPARATRLTAEARRARLDGRPMADAVAEDLERRTMSALEAYDRVLPVAHSVLMPFVASQVLQSPRVERDEPAGVYVDLIADRDPLVHFDAARLDGPVIEDPPLLERAQRRHQIVTVRVPGPALVAELGDHSLCDYE